MKKSQNEQKGFNLVAINDLYSVKIELENLKKAFKADIKNLERHKETLASIEIDLKSIEEIMKEIWTW